MAIIEGFSGDEDDSFAPEPEELEPDPFASYLTDDDDDDGGSEDEKKEEQRLKALVDAKLVERLGKERQQDDDDDKRRTPPAPPQQQQQQQQPPGKSREEILDSLSDELTRDLGEDPKKAVRKLLEINERLGQEASQTANARANRSSIDFYISQMESKDPEFKEYEDELRKKIDNVPMHILAQYTPDGLRAALEQETDAAYGRYMRAKAQKARGQRTSPVPSYGGGDSRPARGISSTPTRLSAAQKQLIKMGESAGLDKKSIRELLKEV